MRRLLHRFCLSLGLLLLLFSVSYSQESSQKNEMADDTDIFAEGYSEEPGASDDRIKELLDRLERLEVDYEKLHQEREIERLLSQTTEEKEAEEEEILSAAEGDYTLRKPGTLQFEYGLSYGYSTSLDNNDNTSKSHNFTNTLSFSFGVLKNLTVNADAPFVYKYYQVGTDESLKVTDLGDTSLGIQVQPFKTKEGGPTTIISIAVKAPSGRSRYKIDPDKDLSTGGGYWSIDSGINMSKALDPVMVFGGLNFSYAFPITGLEYKFAGSGEDYFINEVDPSHNASLSLGMGYAISYNVNISLSLSVSHAFKSTLYLMKEEDKFVDNPVLVPYPQAAYSVAQMAIGSNFRISPTRSLSVSMSHGLTVNAPDFAITFRIPFNFDLTGSGKANG